MIWTETGGSVRPVMEIRLGLSPQALGATPENPLGSLTRKVFQNEQLAKSNLSFRAGTIVDFVPVKTSEINRVQQPQNFRC